MNANKLAAALRAAADAVEEGGATVLQAPTDAPAATPKPRGRPSKVEAPAAAPVEADPFASVATPEPTATLDEVRKALTDLRAATSQDNAVAVLKAASGAGDLTKLSHDKYYAVVAAVKAAMPAAVAPVIVADPFAEPVAVAAEVKVTLEDVQKEVVNAQKRTASDTVQKVVMDAGGKAPRPDGSGGEGPSLKALPTEKYAAVIASLKALPTTK